MTIKEARKVLDDVIPPPDSILVDPYHLPISIAWKTVKEELDRRTNDAEIH